MYLRPVRISLPLGRRCILPCDHLLFPHYRQAFRGWRSCWLTKLIWTLWYWVAWVAVTSTFLRKDQENGDASTSDIFCNRWFLVNGDWLTRRMRGSFYWDVEGRDGGRRLRRVLQEDPGRLKWNYLRSLRNLKVLGKGKGIKEMQVRWCVL